MKFHELTCDVSIQTNKESVDKIIRHWLEEKAEEIASTNWTPSMTFEDKVKKILGLSDHSVQSNEMVSEEKVLKDGHCYKHGKDHLGKCFDCEKELYREKEDKPVEKREWCEHIRFGLKMWIWMESNRSLGPEYLFCERCGKPRPKEVEKRKRLDEIFSEFSIVKGDASCGLSPLKKGEILAEVALTAVIEVWERYQMTEFPHHERPKFPAYLRKELGAE